MGMIYNATNENCQVRVFGNYFEFKPKQMKMLDDKFSHWIQTERKYLGLVDLPDEFADPSYAKGEDGARILATKTEEGVNAFVQRLRERVANVTVSLRMDLEQANIKSDPLSYASDGEVQAFELLAKYQKAKADDSANQVNRLKDLESKIKGA